MEIKVSKKKAVRIIRAIDWFERNVAPFVAMSLMVVNLALAAYWFCYLVWEL